MTLTDPALPENLFVARPDNSRLVDVFLHIKGFEWQAQSLAGAECMEAPNYLPAWMSPAARVAAVRTREKEWPRAAHYMPWDSHAPLGRRPLTLTVAAALFCLLKFVFEQTGAMKQYVIKDRQAPPAPGIPIKEMFWGTVRLETTCGGSSASSPEDPTDNKKIRAGEQQQPLAYYRKLAKALVRDLATLATTRSENSFAAKTSESAASYF
eukprot:scaffold130176_cov34-Prasinocladus_malaysianus.AAC.2